MFAPFLSLNVCVCVGDVLSAALCKSALVKARSPFVRYNADANPAGFLFDRRLVFRGKPATCLLLFRCVGFKFIFRWLKERRSHGGLHFAHKLSSLLKEGDFRYPPLRWKVRNTSVQQ